MRIPNPKPVAGVTIQLLDANGEVLKTTTTDASTATISSAD